MDYRKRNKLAEEFYEKNGACNFDFKGRNIKLNDGGLFAIEEEKVMRHKQIGTKKLPNGMVEILFSKKKYPTTEHNAWMWFEDVDEHINYFRRVKKFLNKLGYKTK
jgi:hypothetical protein